MRHHKLSGTPLPIARMLHGAMLPLKIKVTSIEIEIHRSDSCKSAGFFQADR